MNQKTSRTARGVWCMVLSSVSFVGMGAFVKAVAHTLPVMEIAFFRAFLTLIVLLPSLWAMGRSIVGKRRDLLFVCSSVGFASLALGFYATATIPFANTSILWKTSVIFAAILSVLVLRERVKPAMFIYIGIAFLGACMIVKPTASVFNLGSLAGLGAGLCVAIVGISMRRLQETESSGTIVLHFFFYSTLFSALLVNSGFVMPHAYEWALLSGVALFGLSGQLLFTQSFSYASASTVMPYSFSEVLFSGVLGVTIWGEIPDLWSFAGAGLIVLSGIKILRMPMIE